MLTSETEKSSLVNADRSVIREPERLRFNSPLICSRLLTPPFMFSTSLLFALLYFPLIISHHLSSFQQPFLLCFLFISSPLLAAPLLLLSSTLHLASSSFICLSCHFPPLLCPLPTFFNVGRGRHNGHGQPSSCYAISNIDAASSLHCRRAVVH